MNKHEQFLRQLIADQPGECVTWPYGRASGYAVACRDGTLVKAYRWAWEMLHGRAFPPGLQARHTCGEGARGCVNPWHVVPGSSSENRRDTIAMGRATLFASGTLNPAARHDVSAVDAVRRAVAAGESQRSVGHRFGMSQAHVSRLVNHRQRTTA